MNTTPDRDAWRAEATALILAQLAWVTDRAGPSYPFIDTKWDLVAARSAPADDPVRGRGSIYTWIQGRGLESLAVHAAWLETLPEASAHIALAAGIDDLLRRLIDAMEAARAKNGGRLPFLMAPDGEPLDIRAEGVVRDPRAMTRGHSLSDLFYARGLFAAANRVGDRVRADAARELFDRVVADIRSGAFESGQIALDPRNPVAPVPGRHSHAGRMIALGGATLFWNATRDRSYAELGLEFIDHILARHTRAEAGADGPAGDFWEFINDAGHPWSDADGRLWSDPGHATECAGLALAHIAVCTPGGDPAREAALRRVLVRNFENGFTGIGIVKAFDLRARRVINGDMPWWSLPETIRAAELARVHAPDAEQELLREIGRRCWTAFRRGYVRPEQGMMALQCLAPDGTVSTAIPATPDLDPGYHTGIPLIACLSIR